MQQSFLLCTGLALILAIPTFTTATAADDDWPTYHRTADRTGVAAAGATFSDVQTAWSTGALDGSVYAEPLYAGGRVLVATENNTLYAFDSSSGSMLWQTHLADPVPAGQLPCGNIKPVVGITSTPTVDTDSGVLYAAAMVARDRYELFGVDVNSGGVVFRRALDQAGLDAPAAGQRGALALANGRVYVPFGGRYGDCGSYRGQVVGVSASDPGAPLLVYSTPARRAGIWAPGGVVVGADGTLFVATGNGDARGPEGRTEAVVALSPTLDELDSWQPSNWLDLDRSDTDVGSVPPALLQDLGLAFQSGKDGQGYLLRIGALGGVGGELYSDSIPAGCGGVFGGTAYSPPLLYVPCSGRVVAIRVSGDPPRFALGWRGPDERGQPTVGSPIVVAGAVWDLDFAGRIFALDAQTGATRFQANLPGGPNHFAALAYGNGRVYAATADGVAAYQLIGLEASTP